MNKAICCSHIGKRSNHEDNFYVNGSYLTSTLQKQMKDNCFNLVVEPRMSKIRLFAISDGMGGHNAGEVASLMCVEKLALAQDVLQQRGSLREAVEYLRIVIEQINSAVNLLGTQRSELKGMGATLILVLVYEKDVAVLNIGDSRAYWLENETIVQITKDHTEGQRMLDLGLLEERELSGFSARKNLNRYIGYGSAEYVLQADEFFLTLEKGVLVLCSDGISDFLSEKRIVEIMKLEKNLCVAGKKLVDEAVASKNADNATLMLIPFGNF